jgi:hypothetical protein
MEHLMENLDEKLPSIQGKVCDNYTYSPVNVRMNNTLAAFMLGILAIMLFFSLIKSQKRYQELLERIQ